MDQRILRDTLCLLVLILAVSLLLFIAIPAIAENVLEPAPEVTLPELPAETENTGASALYLPISRRLPNRTEFVSAEEQYALPRLTNEELERTLAFMEDLKAGKELRWDDCDCADRTENVTVGVYPLNPEEFDGETFYVILPDARLTDDMLLSLISAFDRLGIPFEPDLLNERNCMRGNRYSGGTRGLSYEENVRMENIRRRVHRGMIDPKQIPEGTYCRYADTAEAEYQDGLNHAQPYRFCFYPYRRMTDNELAAFAFAADGVWETDPDLLEKQALECLRSLLKVPLPLKPAGEYRQRPTNGYTIYYNHFSVSYADERTGKEIRPGGKAYEFVVVQAQEPGSAQIFPTSIDLYYYFDTDQDKAPDSLSTDELNRIAQEWARENLRLPEEKMPDKWENEVGTAGDSSSVVMHTDMEEFSILLFLNRWDGSLNSCFLLLNNR